LRREKGEAIFLRNENMLLKPVERNKIVSHKEITG
jgi:hypothetical protein